MKSSPIKMFFFQAFGPTLQFFSDQTANFYFYIDATFCNENRWGQPVKCIHQGVGGKGDMWFCLFKATGCLLRCCRCFCDFCPQVSQNIPPSDLGLFFPVEHKTLDEGRWNGVRNCVEETGMIVRFCLHTSIVRARTMLCTICSLRSKERIHLASIEHVSLI